MIGQSIFFSHFPFLKTKIAISYFKHPKWIDHPTECQMIFMDNSGNLIAHKTFTLEPNGTYTMDTENVFQSKNYYGYGICMCFTKEESLGSFRIYATWYNDHSVTTTHEKGAYRNSLPFVTFPIVVQNENHDTYLAICNYAQVKASMTIKAISNNSIIGNGKLAIEMGPHSSTFFAIKELLPIFKEDPNIVNPYIIVEKGNAELMYYYFINNKDTQSWQCQHL